MGLIDLILLFLLLLGVASLSIVRTKNLIKIVGAQGALMALLPLLSHTGGRSVLTIAVIITSAAIKGFALPLLLNRAERDTGYGIREQNKETKSIFPVMAGISLLVISFFIADRLPVNNATASTFILPVSLYTIFTGFILIITKVRAISQVIGYLVLENGIFCFGAAAVIEQPLLVELGILLDVFVAVFVMGLMLFHISREFESTDTEQLSTLSEWDKEKQLS